MLSLRQLQLQHQRQNQMAGIAQKELRSTEEPASVSQLLLENHAEKDSKELYKAPVIGADSTL